MNSSKAVLSGEYPTPRPRSSNNNNVNNNVNNNNNNNVDEEEAGAASDEGVVNDQPGCHDNKSGNELQKPVPHLNTQKSSDSADSSSDCKEEKTSEDDEEQPKKDAADEGDQYKVYYYDPKIPVRSEPKKQEGAASGNAPLPDVFRNLRRNIDDSWEVLFMRAEGIHAHGYRDKACQIATHLAKHLLASAPDKFLRGGRGGFHHHHNNNHGNASNSGGQGESSKTDPSIVSDSTTPGVSSNTPSSNTGAISKVRITVKSQLNY